MKILELENEEIGLELMEKQQLEESDKESGHHEEEEVDEVKIKENICIHRVLKGPQNQVLYE